MKYAPEDVRIDVANAQYTVVHALDSLRAAVEETARIPHVHYYAVTGDADIEAWLRVVHTVTAHLEDLSRVFETVEQIDPYAGREDDFGPLDQPSAARDRLQGRGALVAEAPVNAPDPATAGTAAFGVSRSITPDNPFADVFAARGTFGHVAQ
ncbi:hypothetical protein [Mycolicibacterium porcinum]|uniref:Uncharacterized protein n=1 Tax=Mycolicibacterium porcinum TaxID=39693 RepID=A0ABV3VJR6_9MYCO